MLTENEYKIIVEYKNTVFDCESYNLSIQTKTGIYVVGIALIINNKFILYDFETTLTSDILEDFLTEMKTRLQ